MNAAPWRVVRLLYLIVERSETISSFFVNYRHCSNIVERSETVVDIFVKIVDCRVELAHHCGFNGGLVEILVIFRHDGQFLDRQNGQIIIATR